MRVLLRSGILSCCVLLSGCGNKEGQPEAKTGGVFPDGPRAFSGGMRGEPSVADSRVALTYSVKLNGAKDRQAVLRIDGEEHEAVDLKFKPELTPAESEADEYTLRSKKLSPGTHTYNFGRRRGEGEVRWSSEKDKSIEIP